MGITSDYDSYPVGMSAVQSYLLTAADMMSAGYDPISASLTSNSILYSSDTSFNVGFGTVQSYKLANADILNSNLDRLTNVFTANTVLTSQDATYNVGFGTVQSYKLANTDVFNSTLDNLPTSFSIPNFGVENLSGTVYMSAFAIMPTFAFTSNSYAILSRQLWVTGS